VQLSDKRRNGGSGNETGRRSRLEKTNESIQRPSLANREKPEVGFTKSMGSGRERFELTYRGNSGREDGRDLGERGKKVPVHEGGQRTGRSLKQSQRTQGEKSFRVRGKCQKQRRRSATMEE